MRKGLRGDVLTCDQRQPENFRDDELISYIRN
jgi:hypothetical protein